MKADIQNTLESIRLIWSNLESMIENDIASPVDGSPVTLHIAEGARVGIDEKKRFHLLLNLKSGDEPLRSRLTHGISIRTYDEDQNGVFVKVIDIIAERKWRFAIEPFSAEIVLKMKNGTIALQTLRETVDEHRSLWSKPSEPLTTSEQRGLIGELVVVMKVGSLVSPASIISRWRGPERGLHDIADDEFAIEVKTYSNEPPKVRINHISQLDHRMDKRLSLVGVHLISSDEGKSLPEFIDEAKKWAIENDCLPHLENQLKIAKWSESDRPEYFSRFLIGRSVICPIRPDTRVFPAYLSQHIPSSVSNISYQLHLNDLENISPESDENWRLLLESAPWPSLGDLSPDEITQKDCKRIFDSSVEALVKENESNNLEFKSSIWFSSLPKPELSPQELSKKLQQIIVKTVNGFLNSTGGTLLIGVTDSGYPKGISKDMKFKNLENEDKYELSLVRLLSIEMGRPIIAECVRVSFHKLEGNTVCRVNVKPSNYPIFTKKDQFFIRNSNSTEPLKARDMYEYCLNHWSPIK